MVNIFSTTERLTRVNQKNAELFVTKNPTLLDPLANDEERFAYQYKLYAGEDLSMPLSYAMKILPGLVEHGSQFEAVEEFIAYVQEMTAWLAGGPAKYDKAIDLLKNFCGPGQKDDLLDAWHKIRTIAQWREIRASTGRPHPGSPTDSSFLQVSPWATKNFPEGLPALSNHVRIPSNLATVLWYTYMAIILKPFTGKPLYAEHRKIKVHEMEMDAITDHWRMLQKKIEVLGFRPSIAAKGN